MRLTPQRRSSSVCHMPTIRSCVRTLEHMAWSILMQHVVCFTATQYGLAKQQLVQWAHLLGGRSACETSWGAGWTSLSSAHSPDLETAALAALTHLCLLHLHQPFPVHTNKGKLWVDINHDMRCWSDVWQPRDPVFPAREGPPMLA